MQRLQNMCAKLVLGLNKYDSATEALHTLHWLPTEPELNTRSSVYAINVSMEMLQNIFKCLLQEVIIPRSLRNSSNVRWISGLEMLTFPRHVTLGGGMCTYFQHSRSGMQLFQHINFNPVFSPSKKSHILLPLCSEHVTVMFSVIL